MVVSVFSGRKKVLCCLIRLSCFVLNDFDVDGGDDAHDEDDEAPLYSAVVLCLGFV